MTCSSKSSSVCTQCTMDWILLLQRGHWHLLSAHRRMHAEQNWWRHGITQAALSQVSRHTGQRLSNSVAMLSTQPHGLGEAGHDKLLPLTGAAAASVALVKEERPWSLAGPVRSGRNAQVPEEGNPPSCPG